MVTLTESWGKKYDQDVGLTGDFFHGHRNTTGDNSWQNMMVVSWMGDSWPTTVWYFFRIFLVVHPLWLFWPPNLPPGLGSFQWSVETRNATAATRLGIPRNDVDLAIKLIYLISCWSWWRQEAWSWPGKKQQRVGRRKHMWCIEFYGRVYAWTTPTSPFLAGCNLATSWWSFKSCKRTTVRPHSSPCFLVVTSSSHQRWFVKICKHIPFVVWSHQTMYPLVICLHSYWKWPIKIVDLPINSMVDLSMVMLVY